MSEKYFQNALADFTVDFAAGGAVRVMADKGYTVCEIKEKLDYPLSKTKIAELVWKHYLETGVIRLTPPEEESAPKRVHYEKVQDRFGKTSFRQVVSKEESGCGNGGNSSDNNGNCNSWFVGFSTSDKPDIVVSVVVEDYTSNQLSGTYVASRLMDQYYNDH